MAGPSQQAPDEEAQEATASPWAKLVGLQQRNGKTSIHWQASQGR